MTDDQINELNERVKIRIAPSKVHGVGIFAIRDILKGQKVYAYHMETVYTVPYSSFNKLFPEVAAIIKERWPQVVNGSHFTYPESRYQAYMNHSNDPNYFARTDVALTNIKAGEEVLEDYRMIENYAQVFPWLEDKKEKGARTPGRRRGSILRRSLRRGSS